MSVAEAQRRVTPEEYLALERAAETRSEYLDGQVYAMSGASRAHNLITGDAFAELRTQLRGGLCQVYLADMRVKVTASGTYTYPDVVVACGDIRFEDAEVDTLLNPTAVIEVLSPSTEFRDRGPKLEQYMQLPSLQEYLIVAQDRVWAHHYQRRGDEWVLRGHSDLAAVIELPSIGCRLALREVYARVEFGPAPEPTP